MAATKIPAAFLDGAVRGGMFTFLYKGCTNAQWRHAKSALAALKATKGIEQPEGTDASFDKDDCLYFNGLVQNKPKNGAVKEIYHLVYKNDEGTTFLPIVTHDKKLNLADTLQLQTGIKTVVDQSDEDEGEPNYSDEDLEVQEDAFLELKNMDKLQLQHELEKSEAKKQEAEALRKMHDADQQAAVDAKHKAQLNRVEAKREHDAELNKLHDADLQAAVDAKHMAQLNRVEAKRERDAELNKLHDADLQAAVDAKHKAQLNRVEAKREHDAELNKLHNADQQAAVDAKHMAQLKRVEAKREEDAKLHRMHEADKQNAAYAKYIAEIKQRREAAEAKKQQDAYELSYLNKMAADVQKDQNDLDEVNHMADVVEENNKLHAEQQVGAQHAKTEQANHDVYGHPAASPKKHDIAEETEDYDFSLFDEDEEEVKPVHQTPAQTSEGPAHNTAIKYDFFSNEDTNEESAHHNAIQVADDEDSHLVGGWGKCTVEQENLIFNYFALMMAHRKMGPVHVYSQNIKDCKAQLVNGMNYQAHMHFNKQTCLVAFHTDFKGIIGALDDSFVDSSETSCLSVFPPVGVETA